MLENREILIYLSVKFNGEFSKIFDFFINKQDIDEVEARELIATIKSRVITIFDEDYPDYLKRIYKPPFVLFYYGDISLIKDLTKNVAVIGSRECTDYGVNRTKEIVSKIAQKYHIVSGMARGIDTCAHNACILYKGKTIAVLGSGIDYCYPVSNKKLYEKIKKEHLLISEYPNSVVPNEANFPMRNRLISAFASCLVITEAKHQSGTSITCSIALTEGKDVCCVPYIADKSSLCNELIKQGANLIEDGEDLLEFLGDYSFNRVFEM